MPSSAAICRIGLSLPACAISMSDGTGRRSLSLVGTNGTIAFLPLDDKEAPAFLTRGFFGITFLGEAFPVFDFPIGDFLVAMFAPSIQSSTYIIKNFKNIDNCLRSLIFVHYVMMRLAGALRVLRAPKSMLKSMCPTFLRSTRAQCCLIARLKKSEP